MDSSRSKSSKSTDRQKRKSDEELAPELKDDRKRSKTDRNRGKEERRPRDQSSAMSFCRFWFRLGFCLLAVNPASLDPHNVDEISKFLGFSSFKSTKAHSVT